MCNLENTERRQQFEQAVTDGEMDELNELKSWLFKENIRLQNQQNELSVREDMLKREKEQFKAEVEEIKHRLKADQKRFVQKEAFFNKKMDILKNGFAELEGDRKKFEREKLRLEAERNAYSGYTMEADLANMLFRGVNSQLALKKRYKDLIKMFHPDNIAGDHEMVQAVNKTYEKMKHDYELIRRA